MLVVIGWVGLSIAVAKFAGTRGREGIGWFILSLIISPALAFIILLVLDPKNLYEKELARERLRQRVQEDLEEERRTGKLAAPRRDRYGSFIRS